MNKTQLAKMKILTWGFPDEEFVRWPEDLQAEPVSKLPREEPVLVHANAVESFKQAAQESYLPDGRMQRAILYVPHGMEVPKETAFFFDETIWESQWQDLRQAVSHPQKYEMAEWAEEVPVTSLEDVLEILDEVQIESSWFENLPIPDDVIEHLLHCLICQKAFTQVLDGRLRWRYQIMCPPEEMLSAHALGETVPWVNAHLVHCSNCQAEVELLNIVIGSKPVFLEIGLRIKGWQAYLRAMGENLDQKTEKGLHLLIRAFLDYQLKPVGVGVRFRGRDINSGIENEKMRVDTLGEDEIQEIVEVLIESGKLNLWTKFRDLSLIWSESEKAITIHSLEGKSAKRVRNFRVEMLPQGEFMLKKDSVAGKVTITLDELYQSLKSGAERLVITALDPEGNPEEV
jgi:hypothetical protein